MKQESEDPEVMMEKLAKEEKIKEMKWMKAELDAGTAKPPPKKQEEEPKKEEKKSESPKVNFDERKNALK